LLQFVLPFMKKYAFIIMLAVGPFLFSFSDFDAGKREDRTATVSPDTFPVPKNVPGLLFYIQRDPNTNTICYEINTDKQGKVQSSNPVNVFWIRYPEGGMRKDLNYFQRKFAYGINSKSVGDGTFELRSVAYNKLPLYLRKDNDEKYRVYTSIDKKECVLSRVFIRIDGGTFWSPNVLYIELRGKEVATGKTIVQRIKPS
jgi:hypothetical protein